MDGESLVYRGVEGTGAAWIGPRSSFDPVALGAKALSYQQAQKKADDQARQRRIDSLMKTAGVSNTKLIDTDYFNSIKKHNDNHYNALGKKYMEQGTLTDLDLFEEEQWQKKQRDRENIFAYQKEFYTKHMDSFQKDGGGLFNQNAMKKRGLMYLRPDLFTGDQMYGEQISQTFQPILDAYLEDESYRDSEGNVDKDWATQDAIMEWRQQYGHAILQPILSPVSLNEDFKKNVGPLVGQYTISQKSGGSFGSEVSQLIERTSVDDQEVELDDGTITTVRGIRTAAGVNYNGNVRVRESALENFVSLKDIDITSYDKYLNKANGDTKKASFDWYVDQMSNLGQKIEIKETYKEGKSVNWNGQNLNEGVSIDDWNGVLNLNYIGVPDPTAETPQYIDSYKKTTVNGLKVSVDGKPLRLFVNPNEVYDQNMTSWKGAPTEGSGNYFLDANSIFVAPVLAHDIDLNSAKFSSLKSVLEKMDSKSATEMWRLLKENNGKIKAGIILSDNEINLLSRIDRGLIAERSFISGSMTTQEEGVTTQGTMKRSSYKLQGAIIPTDQISKDFHQKVLSTPEDLLRVGQKFGRYPLFNQQNQQNQQPNSPDFKFDSEDEFGYYDSKGNLIRAK